MCLLIQYAFSICSFAHSLFFAVSLSSPSLSHRRLSLSLSQSHSLALALALALALRDLTLQVLSPLPVTRWAATALFTADASTHKSTTTAPLHQGQVVSFTP